MTEQKYNIGNGHEISVEYDEYGMTKITRECFEALIENQYKFQRCGECEEAEFSFEQARLEASIPYRQAWNEVLQKLEEQLHNGEDSNWTNATINAICIINQHLAEIEEVR